MAFEKNIKTRFECLAVYVPERAGVNSEVLPDDRKLRLLFQKITGIKKRRISAENEFTFDLAYKTCRKLLHLSKYGPHDIDLIIFCGITKSKGGLFTFHYEPSFASLLKKKLNCSHAQSFDVTNACAGMFTGIFLMDAMIRAGSIKRGIVVSAERITDLGALARDEIRNIFDRQIPSFTLGDAGAAVLMEKAEDLKGGLCAIDLTTVAHYKDLCLAFPKKNKPGVKMVTRGKQLHQAGIKIELKIIKEFLAKCKWDYNEIDVIIPHQTSVYAIKAGAKVLNRYFEADKKKEGLIIADKFGNTASTSHILALHEGILSHKIKEKDKIVFLIQASGIVIGHCAYEMDHLAVSMVKNQGETE